MPLNLYWRKTYIFQWYFSDSCMAINADKSRFLRTCNAKVEGSIPFTGTNKIKFATQSLGRQWKMRQEKLSPSFTTKLQEIITIKAD